MEGVFQTKERKQTARVCVYCEKQGHKASQCESVKSVDVFTVRNKVIKLVSASP